MKLVLNILQVCNRLPFPLNDGGNIATYYVAKHLSEAGHKLRIASLNTKKHYQEPGVLSHLAPTYTIDINTNLTFAGLLGGLFTKSPYNVERFRSAAFETLLVELINSESPDVIQLEGSYLGIYVPLLRQYTKAKIVLRSHNVEHQIWLRMAEAETNPLKKLYLKNLSPKIRRFEEDTLHDYDAILAITPLDMAYYKAHGFRGPILHLPAGVEIDKELAATEKCYDLGFIGSMEWLPNVQGVEWFVEKCWRKIVAENPDKKFYIAGKHIPENWWIKEVAGIVVLGQVEDAHLFMRNCKLFVVPLLSGGGMRVKIVEAMAQEVAIVATSVGAEGIEAIPGKEICIVDEADKMITEIQELWKFPQRISSIGQQARIKAVQRYNWKNIVANLESFYEGLVQQKQQSYTESEY